MNRWQGPWPPAEITGKTGQHELGVKKNMTKLGNIATIELLNIKLNLTDAEYILKTGQTDAMSAFCRAFCRGGG